MNNATSSLSAADVPVVDVQHHYVPRRLAEAAGWRPGQVHHVTRGDQRVVTLHDRLVDLDWHLSDMEAAGIDTAVLSCFNGWDASAEDCRLINDDLRSQRDRYGARFDGFASLPLHSEAEALRELERASGELGLPGVTVMNRVNGRQLDDPTLYPVYARIEELQMAIFVHPVLGVSGHEGAGDFDLGRILAREFDLATAVTRVIAAGVLDRFPGLAFIFAHFGGGVAAIKERIRNKAFRFGTNLSRSFDEYFADLYFDMAGFEGGPGALGSALTGISPTQLLFATDYPQDFTGVMTGTGVGLEGIRSYAEAVWALELPEDQRAGMLGGNWGKLALGASRTTPSAGSGARSSLA